VKTNTGVTEATSAMLDVMPAMVRVPVVVVNPGFMSAGVTEKLADVIADTAMVPRPPPIAVATPVDTTESITKPAAVWVITLNVPAA